MKRIFVFLGSFDISLVCFILVIVSAVPVIMLRSKTYTVGYEIGKLKRAEHVLRQKQDELETELATYKSLIRQSSAKTYTLPKSHLIEKQP